MDVDDIDLLFAEVSAQVPDPTPVSVPRGIETHHRNVCGDRINQHASARFEVPDPVVEGGSVRNPQPLDQQSLRSTYIEALDEFQDSDSGHRAWPPFFARKALS